MVPIYPIFTKINGLAAIMSYMTWLPTIARPLVTTLDETTHTYVTYPTALPIQKGKSPASKTQGVESFDSLLPVLYHVTILTSIHDNFMLHAHWIRMIGNPCMPIRNP